MDGVLFFIIIPTEKEENLNKTSFFGEDITEDRKTKCKENTTYDENEMNADDTDSSPKEKLLNEHKSSKNKPCNASKEKKLRDFFPRKDSNDKNVTSMDAYDLNIPLESPMVQVLEEIIERGKITEASWTQVRNGKKWQIMFAVENGRICDQITQWLNDWVIGYREGSTVILTPCTVHDFTTNAESHMASQIDLTHKEGIWERFVSSVTARLNVAQLVDQVRLNAEIRFDFVTLIVVAAILAGFGLVENNSLFLAASMLISPLMGPIVAATFGTVIKDRQLTKLGVTNELLGILLACLVGFVFGLIVCISEGYYGLQDGLTREMLSRCELHSLVVGILIALPSGVAVAIGILGENAGSLAGVAISASLLPPAVNSGFLWAVAAFYNITGQETNNRFLELVKTSQYSKNHFTELILQATVSLGVTLTNVISIYLMGVLVLRIKEVAPMVTKTHTKFWKHDIKIARDYNKTCQFDDAQSLRQKLEREIEGFEAKMENRGSGVRAEIIRRVSRGALPLNGFNNSTWNNIGHAQNSRPTIQDIEALYNDTNVYPMYPKYPPECGRGSFLIPENRNTVRRSSMPAWPKSQTKSHTFKKLDKITEMVTSQESSDTPKSGKKTFTVLSVDDTKE